MALERLVVDSDSTTPDLTVIRDDTSGSLIADYSNYYERIAASAERIAVAAETMATNSTTIATNSTTIATKLTAIETYQKKLKELGETTGIHVVGPYDWLGLINVYRSLIEQGGIADTQGNVSDAKRAEAIALVNAYISKIQAFPTGF